VELRRGVHAQVANAQSTESVQRVRQTVPRVERESSGDVVKTSVLVEGGSDPHWTLLVADGVAEAGRGS